MDIFFFIRQSKKTRIGILQYGIRDGQKIILRKSLKVYIPFALWSEERERVKATKQLDYVKINELIEQTIKSFNKEPVNFILNEETDFFEFAESQIKNIENVDTQKKYRTTIKKFSNFILSSSKTLKFPMGEFRKPIWIENYKNHLKIQTESKNKKRMKMSTIRNYLLILHRFVKDWNRLHSIENPIPVQYFLYDTKGSEKINHRSLDSNDLECLEEFKTKSVPQMAAKNLFLFQLYAGGIRVADAFMMRFSSLKDNGLYYVMKKNKSPNYINFDYLIAQPLGYFYPKEYQMAIERSVLGKIPIPVNDFQLHASRLKTNNIEDIINLTIYDISNLVNKLNVDIDRRNSDLVHFLEDVLRKMEDMVALEFHALLSKFKEGFLFPYLIFDDFKNLPASEPYRIDVTQSAILQRARAKHNSNLKRISFQLGIGDLSGHVPRHTIAFQMLEAGSSIEEIGLVLGHSNFATTHLYLKKFPERLHRGAMEKFRSVFRGKATRRKH
jgi:site-specific recombinase XerD